MMTNHRYKGFTLLELLIVMGIISILVVLSQLDLTSKVAEHKSQSAANTLLTSLAFAKSEAIKRHAKIGICGIDEKACSTDWSRGYQVFILEQGIRGQIIRYFSPPQDLLIHSQKQPMIIFNHDGRCLTRGTIYISKNDTTQKIVIYDSGRARIESHLVS